MEVKHSRGLERQAQINPISDPFASIDRYLDPMNWISASLLALIFLVPVELNGLQWFPHSTLAFVIETKANADSNVDDHSCSAACLVSATDRLEFDSTGWVAPHRHLQFIRDPVACFFSRGPPTS